MTMPPMPEHPRFKMIEGHPHFQTMPNVWRGIVHLDEFERQNCVAIARCYWTDESSDAAMSRKSGSRKASLDASRNSEAWWKLVWE